MPRRADQRRISILRGAALLGLAGAAAMPAVAAEDRNPIERGERLDRIERSIDTRRSRGVALSKRMAAIAREIDGLRKRLVGAAEKAQFREAELIRSEIELAELEARERRSRAGYRDAQRQLARLLGALQRIRRHPPGAFAIRFDSADDAIRSTVVLRALLPKIEDRTVTLRERLQTFAALKANIRKRRDNLREQRDALGQLQTKLAALVSEQSKLLDQTQTDRTENAKRIAALTREARSLRELVEKLDRERDKSSPPTPTPRAEALTRPERVRPFGKARGRVIMPVAGRVSRQFGETDTSGLTVRGLEIKARGGAQVVAPYDGQIVFAGPFRSYGQILIIRHGDRYHSLVAGLSRINVVNKQWVLAGEPVGVVGERSAAGPRLYLEIRRLGRPINPLPWLAADKRKVNG